MCFLDQTELNIVVEVFRLLRVWSKEGKIYADLRGVGVSVKTLTLTLYYTDLVELCEI